MKLCEFCWHKSTFIKADHNGLLTKEEVFCGKNCEEFNQEELEKCLSYMNNPFKSSVSNSGLGYKGEL
jgi:hypothetical protein